MTSGLRKNWQTAKYQFKQPEILVILDWHTLCIEARSLEQFITCYSTSYQFLFSQINLVIVQPKKLQFSKWK